MSGHSHWATIRRSKAANDSKRGKIWSKLARRVIMAAKNGGDPNDNLTLRYAIDDAKAANMPKDTIAKAIKKGTGELGAEDYEQALYEGYGPSGTAFLIDCLTNNRNRTAPELRQIFDRAGGQLGASNCVAWMFDQKGTFLIAADATTEEQLMEIVLDAGADDIVADSNGFEIACEVAAFSAVKQALLDAEIETLSSEIAMIPQNPVVIDDLQFAKRLMNILDSFDDHDDVQNVYSNFDIPDELADQLDD